MSKDEHEAPRGVAEMNRRDLLVGGVAAAAAAALPGEGQARSTVSMAADQQVHTLGATYLNPIYKDTFDSTYSFDKITDVHAAIIKKYGTNRNQMIWGDYQHVIMPLQSNWGSAEAYYSWPYFVNEVRNDLEKQNTVFTANDPSSYTNPFDASKNQVNLRDHLDEVVRIALYDYAVEIKVVVVSAVRRHHVLTTKWTLRNVINAPNPGIKQELACLTITIECPQGGWQAYTFSRSSASSLTQFAAQWKVPSMPAVPNGGQMIFIFSGLESLSNVNGVGGILQPVLQFTNNQWAVRSWYMRADFDPTKGFETFPDLTTAQTNKYAVPFVPDTSGKYPDNRTYSLGTPVNEGDIITGSINVIKDSSGVSSYVCSILVNGNSPTIDTTLTIPFSKIPAFVYAVCAVESYNVPPYDTNPTEQYYPEEPIKLSNFTLATQTSQVNPISWTRSKTLGRDYSSTVLDSGATVAFTLA